ncbi:hypothetical protein [Streptomyces sp. NPDC094031]|uniref:hypothetical protein n=1 Tax=Streptomyces sp. NPDC094031 TaxID=3155307 RepID=UPI00331FA336
MVTEDDSLWQRCAHLGRVLLSVVDQEEWRRTRRHESLRDRGIDTGVGERLIAIIAALVAHAVVVDAAAENPVPGSALDAVPVRVLAEATVAKSDLELLAGLPGTFDDEREEQAVNLFRLSSYQVGPAGHRLAQLRGETRYALATVADRSAKAPPSCGDLLRWAAEAERAQ